MLIAFKSQCISHYICLWCLLMPQSLLSDSSDPPEESSPSKKKWKTHSRSDSPASKGKAKGKKSSNDPLEDSVALLIHRNLEDRKKV